MSAIFMLNPALTVANRISEILIEEYDVLAGVGWHVEWIEKELRSIHGLLEQIELHGHGQQRRVSDEWAEQLMKTVGDAENVIENFVIKSVKRRRWGVLYLSDKYKIGKELVQIRKEMRDISQKIMTFNTNVVVTTHGGEASSSSNTTSVVAPAIERLDHILSGTIAAGDKVAEMVEGVKCELVQLQNIVDNLKSTSERETAWLKEVKEVCNYTESVAGNFIFVKERWSKMDRVKKVFYLLPDYHFEKEFLEKMKYVRTQIGDALQRIWTYGIGGQLDYKQTAPRSTAIQNLWVEMLMIGNPFSGFRAMLARYLELWLSVEKKLKFVERDLDLMLAFLRDTAESSQSMNERQKVWVSQLRLVAQNAQSFVDAYSEAGWFMRFSRRIQFSEDMDYLLKEILSNSHRKNIYSIANIQGTREELVVATSPIIQEEEEIHMGTEPAAPSSYRPVIGLRGKVQSMREEMELMDALLQDVQGMGGGELDRRSRIWVDQMQDIATEARSVINDYAAKLENKSFLTVLFQHQTWKFINDKINGIINKFEDASRRRKAYGLVEIQSQSVSSSIAQILRGRTQPPVVVAEAKESLVVGFDEDAQVLIAQLLSGEKRRCITWIVGIRGTGKTTLAKLIFQDSAVVSHFDCQVWVSVPSTSNSDSNYTAQQLLEEIAKESAMQIKGILSSDPVLETLARKRYLIVVDGIEETNSKVLLDTVKEAIPDMLTNSRLLLTTRNTNVAQHTAGTITFVHPLQLLDDESSWLLFRRHLKMDNTPGELMTVRKKFVVKCGGLPSQILKMSYLLSHKGNTVLTDEEWSSILDQIQDQIQSWSEALKTINTDLSLYLRRYLSYFLLFPDEFEIPVRRLVILWVAESLVHHSEEDGVPPELVAERYLTELIDRNMVQVAARKRNGKVKTCRLPNALRQLWLTDSRSLQGRRTTTDMNADPRNFIIRRVADHLNSEDIWHDHIHGDTILKPSSLKTYYKDVLSFMSFDPQEGSKPGQQIGNFLKRCISSNCFLLLRVLDLERVYKPKLPKRISRLTRLRYLGLRWTYLESLPSSISKLLKLQTLDLKHTYIHTLPTSIWKMELRHLFLSETYRTRFPPQPKDNSLSDLQTLWGLFVDEETPVKGGLDKLINITKLGLACQSMSLQEDAMKKQLEAVAGWITKLEHLQSLRLKSRDEQGKPWILHLNSYVDHTNLTDIYLLGSLNSSNVLSQFPLSLIELTLSHSKLEDDPMTLLKDFPNLRTLCLLAESYVGTTMVCESQSFPQLRVLKLWVLEQLDEWIIEPGALPCLRQLEIRSCPRLKMLPDGLKHVNTLLELKLTNMPMEINADTHNIPPNCQIV